MPLPLVTVVRSISEAKIATEGHPALAAPLEDALPASAIELIAAPSGLGLSRPDGRVPRVDLLPQALLEAGLGQGLQFVAAQPCACPPTCRCEIPRPAFTTGRASPPSPASLWG